MSPSPLCAKDEYIRPCRTLCATTAPTFKQPTMYIYALPLFNQQPSELSLSSQGRLYTSKIANFNNHVKICQEPKKVLGKISRK